MLTNFAVNHTDADQYIGMLPFMQTIWALLTNSAHSFVNIAMAY